MEYLIRTYTFESETVLNFVMSSGSTGVACLNIKRKFIGIDNGVCKKENSQFYNMPWVAVAKYSILNEKSKQCIDSSFFKKL